MLCFLGLCRLEVGAHFAKKHSILNDFSVRKAVWKLRGGAGDSCAPRVRPVGRNRSLLIRPGCNSRAFVSEDEWFTGGCGPLCLAPILNQVFIATMIGSQEAKYKGARRWTLARIPVPIRTTATVGSEGGAFVVMKYHRALWEERGWQPSASSWV
jgi:hypothetical protein